MLTEKVKNLPTVGAKTEEKLKRLNVKTLRDLLYYFPRTYKDLSRRSKVSDINKEGEYTIEATLQACETRRSFRKRRMAITEGLIGDQSGSIGVVWFNQPYLKNTLKPGSVYLFNGKVKLGPKGLQMQSPVFEPIKKEQMHIGRVIPIYPATEGITPKMLRFLIKTTLDREVKNLKETLKKETIERQKLMPLREAIWEIHFPTSKDKFLKARERFAFEELLPLQVEQLKRKAKLSKFKSNKVPENDKLMAEFEKSLSFKLTGAQKRAAEEILKDMSSMQPMNRLLNGDVGSGKTVVAAAAMLACANSKLQSALMAPTEVLAQQHFKTLSELFKDHGLSVTLLTSETEDKNAKLDDIESGKVDIIIGTHALIQKSVKFKDLALVIIDEQHRFGVDQRKALRDKTPKLIPHVLSMTATPIPRSLTLALYGDLDISVLKEMPKHRKPIKTFYVAPAKRKDSYNFIKKEIKKGNKAFVVCPVIEESDKLGVKAATEEFNKLKENVFPELEVGILHGRMKKCEKEKIVEQFRQPKTRNLPPPAGGAPQRRWKPKTSLDILVTTAVVEVGVDIPDATVMMIEGAERFGLAQLHQFRGRVGRSSKQSYCLLFTDSDSDSTKRRLKSLIQTNDGFKLANEDLKQRGPGELWGARQHGFIDLRFASIFDTKFVKRVREEAELLLSQQ